MSFIAWSKGNTNMYTHESEEKINPINIKEVKLDRDYYYTTIIVETVSPSAIPCFFKSKYDTLDRQVQSRYKR